MDCHHNDDLCHLKQDYAEYVADAERDEQVDRNMVVLGIFNGRAYAYSEVNGKSVIAIMPAKPDKIGKFDLPDDVKSDYIESGGAMTVGTPGAAKSEAKLLDIKTDTYNSEGG